MNTTGLGIGAAWHELDPSSYAPGSASADLAHKLDPLIRDERQTRRDAERAAHDADPAGAATRANLFGGLLGPKGVPGLDFFAIDSTPWHDLLTDVEFLARCAQVVGMRGSELAQAIVDHLMPPNWLVFFWMGRALESVPLEMARRWSDDAAKVARAEAEQAEKSKATNKGRALADAAWAQAREQRTWWEREWAQAKAANSKLSKKAFVERHWLAYLALDPKPRYTEDTVATKWLRGK